MPFPIVRTLAEALDLTHERVAPVRLPEDELAHDFPVEWWYFAAHLNATDSDERLSIMLTAIRGKKRLLPAAATVSFVKRIDHRRGPLAVLQAGTAFALAYSHQRRLASYRLRYEGSILDFWNATPERWTITGTPVHYRIDLFDGDDVLELGLDLIPTNDAVLLGDQGVVEYGGGHELAYYVRPKIAVVGEARIDGVMRPVRGRGWYERQWGTAPTDAYAWKYVNVSLDDDEQWIFFHTRLGEHVRYDAYRMPPGGGIERVPVDADAFRNVEVGGRPLGTDMRVQRAGSLVEFRVRPLFGDEPDIRPVYPGVPGFWESACRVEGTRNGQPVRGWSMTELHAYG
jgi:predicted secreted hydrolase